MAHKKRLNYFDAFERQADLAAREVKILCDAVDDYPGVDGLKDLVDKAHDIEHEGDVVPHEVFNALAVDFMPPLDRDDIITITKGLDDVIDYLEGTIQRFYMHNVETLPEELKDYAKLLRKSTKALCAALKEFRNFKKSKKIMGLIDDIAGIEEEGDELFFRSMHDLYANSTNPIQVHVGDMLYQRLENAIDACEHVSDIMGTILLKNS